MSSAIYCRVLGQAVALGMHSVNSISMITAMQDEQLMKDPQINTMTSLQTRYFTVWNMCFQMLYFSLGFVCDVWTISGKDHMIPKSVLNIRQTFFTAILWPSTMLVFTLFWPFFLVDRELLFPAFIDKIFPFKNNMMMHFWILPVLLWEALFLPRRTPKSYTMHITILSTIYAAYVALILHTYQQRGVWPYPIIRHIYGTIYFPLCVAVAYLLYLALYFLQWKLHSLAKTEKIKTKKIK